MPRSLLAPIINKITFRFNRLTNPELAHEIARKRGEAIVEAYYASGMRPQTGTTVRALGSVGEPRKTLTGWEVPVMDPAVGSPDESAPPGTIGDFLEWYSRQKHLPQFFIRGGVPSNMAWWLLTRTQKRVLQEQRLAGRFGGQTGAGAGRAPYVWPHEEGSPAAGIAGRGFIEAGTLAWEQEVPRIIARFYREGK